MSPFKSFFPIAGFTTAKCEKYFYHLSTFTAHTHTQERGEKSNVCAYYVRISLLRKVENYRSASALLLCLVLEERRRGGLQVQTDRHTQSRCVVVVVSAVSARALPDDDDTPRVPVAPAGASCYGERVDNSVSVCVWRKLNAKKFHSGFQKS